MSRSWSSLILSVVMLVPEPATFALLVFAAACFVVSALRAAPGFFSVDLRVGVARVAQTPAAS